MQSAAIWLRKDRRCHLPVLYVFERGDKWQKEADALLTGMAVDESARKYCLYRNHVFEDKKNEYGLQAADLFVWTVTKLHVGGGYKPSIRPWVDPIQKLGGTDKHRTVVLSVTGPALQKFFDNAVRIYPSAALVNIGPRKRAFR